MVGGIPANIKTNCVLFDLVNDIISTDVNSQCMLDKSSISGERREKRGKFVFRGPDTVPGGGGGQEGDRDQI